MYCSKCKKQSPDNFKICAYCGATLDGEAVENKVKKAEYSRKKHLPKMKSVVLTLIIIALVIAVVSGAVGIATSAKPQSTLELLCEATQENNSGKYLGIYDESYLAYAKENEYYSDSALREALCEPLVKSVEFYTSTCGEGFKVSYSVDNIVYVKAEELEALNSVLFDEYGYYKECKNAAVIDFSVTAKGENGEYTSVYKNFYCIKISGKWYKAPRLLAEEVNFDE